MDRVITRKVKDGRNVRVYALFTCEHCGKEFEARVDQRHKYCSHECSSLERRKPGERINDKHAFLHICKYCGKEYVSLKKISSYCSKECISESRKGESSPLYKGGFYVDDYKHIAKDDGGYIREHRKIVEEVIGRRLSPNEDVHHINEDKLDNKLENLAILTKSEHARIHHYLRGNGHMTYKEYETIIARGKQRIYSK